MTSHGPSDSLTGAIVSGEITSVFREEQEEPEEVQRAKHRNRHLSKAISTIQEHLDEAIEIERTMTSREKLETTSAMELLQDSQTDPTKGLSVAEAQARLERDGFNELEEEDSVPLWKLFAMQFMNFLILLLLAASIASFSLGEYVEGIAVIIIVLITASIAVYTEKSASDALAALADMSQASATVIRGGESRSIPTKEVVTGDIILVETGDVVPADCILLDSAELKVNEMPLTGEAKDVAKNHAVSANGGESELTPPNRIFSSTTVTAGSAKGLVTATGMDTRVGEIAKLLSGGDEKKNCLGVKEPKRTPLQQKLHTIGLIISSLALTACVAVFIIGVARNFKDPEKPDESVAVNMVLVAVSLAVSAIPEGLPLAVTIALALGTNDMAKNYNSLVRRLPAVETLGSAQVICSDKTGTLTEGKMTALKLWTLSSQSDHLGREIEISGRGLLPVGDFIEGGKTLVSETQTDRQVHSTLLSGLMNSTAELRVQENPADASTIRSLEKGDLTEDFAEIAVDKTWIGEGNTSEVPIVVAAAKANIFALKERPKYPTVGFRASGREGPEVPFSSSRKMMISVVHVDDGQFGHIQLPEGCKYAALIKGAPNYVVDNCTSGVYRDGKLDTFSEQQRKQVMTAVDDLSSQALRVLAVALKPLKELPYDPCDPDVDAEKKFELLKDETTFVGLIASLDPERKGVQNAIHVARGAGVKTIMITGDYLKTAVAIGKNIDLITLSDDPEQVAVDCSVLRPLGPGQYLPEKDMDEITSRCVVFARAKPEDKLHIVQSLQRQGIVTSMTGDGVNDAPALNEADIGVAMGVAGTEVAKGASDMILLDDNFVTIVSAIRKGRQIYSNIQKFIVYLLGTNMSQVMIILTSVIAGLPVPLGPLSILFLNLSIDGIPTMALSVQPADEGIMDQQPRPPKQPLITSRMWVYCFGHATYLSLCTLASYALGLDWFIGEILTSNILPNGELLSSCSVRQEDGSRVVVDQSSCVSHGLKLARTMAFITIVYACVLRGLTARSELAWYKGIFHNKILLAAMTFSCCLATALLLIPGLRELFGFEGTDLPYWAWLTSLAFAVSTVFFNEIVKLCFRRSDAREAENLETRRFFEELKMDIRQIRHSIIDLETKMHLREERPVKRLVIQDCPRALAHALHKAGVDSVEMGNTPKSKHDYDEHTNLKDQVALDVDSIDVRRSKSSGQ